MSVLESIGEEWRNGIRTLGAGCEVAVLRSPALSSLRFPAGLYWIGVLLCGLVDGLLAWLAVDPPRRFVTQGVLTGAFDNLFTLFLAWVVARGLAREALFWPLAVLMTSAGLFVDTLLSLCGDHILPMLPEDYQQTGAWFYLAFAISWWGVIINHSARLLAPTALTSRRLALVGLCVLMMTIVPLSFPQYRYFDTDSHAAHADAAEPEKPRQSAEEAFSRQPALLQKALAGVVPGKGTVPQLFVVAFAPYGRQGVFYREASYAVQLFQSRFGTSGHTLLLANTHADDGVPMATLTNLEGALQDIAKKMDVSKDILFLFLTSHGSKDAELSMSLDGFDFRPFTSRALGKALKDSGIRYKVIVVSGCYSGSFVPALVDPDTMVMTAAAADRTSFGCSDGADFTYFGRAYFQRALNETTSFDAAFARARSLVRLWEEREDRLPSNPQIATTKSIDAQIARWQATLPENLPVIPALLPHEAVLQTLDDLGSGPPAQAVAPPQELPAPAVQPRQ